MAVDVTKHPETAHFWIGQYSPEFWDESTRRKRSGKGVTTEREIADAIFTMKKRAFRIEDWSSFGYNLMDPIYVNTHWFGRTEYIWIWPRDPEANLILFMRSDNGKPVVYDHIRHPLTHNSPAGITETEIGAQVPKTGEKRGDFQYHHLLCSPTQGSGGKTANANLRLSGRLDGLYFSGRFFPCFSVLFNTVALLIQMYINIYTVLMSWSAAEIAISASSGA